MFNSDIYFQSIFKEKVNDPFETMDWHLLNGFLGFSA